MPINLSLVSPSSVGDYAACTQRLLFDSRTGKSFGPKMHADFGTVCHYFTMYLLGVAPPNKAPGDELVASARQLPEFKGRSEQVFFDAVTKASQKAVDALPPLTHPLVWIAESKHYDRTLLPTRVGRKGDISGFGGDVDLMRSDRDILWDLKFVGSPPDKMRVAYIWQMGSYHIVSKVPKTGILFVTRDGRSASKVVINWTLPHMVDFANRIRGFIESTGHTNFEKHVYPLAGEHCFFCDHKGKCATQMLPSISAKTEYKIPEVTPADQDHFLDSFLASQTPIV